MKEIRPKRRSFHGMIEYIHREIDKMHIPNGYKMELWGMLMALQQGYEDRNEILLSQIEGLERFNTDCPEWVKNVIRGNK